MTPIEKMSDQEMNIAVAKKLGWRVGRFTKDGKEHLAISDKEDESLFFDKWGQLPPYSTSIEACWEIIEKPELAFQLMKHMDGSWFVAVSSMRDIYAEAKADTAPRAIVMAFLKLP